MRGALVGIAVGMAVVAASGRAGAGSVTVEQHAGRSVRVFVPTKVASPTPMVVMLHGCTQTADAFADATRMDVVAEANGFVVAYPEQSSSTIATRCFQWYEPAHQARDAGEPKELADATDEVAKGHGVALDRVYVAGISAGAAMTVILGAAYPDRFTAIGVIAGVEYKAAGSVSEGLSVAQSGGPDPMKQGDLAHAQMGTRARIVPTFVVHGTADGVLAKTNGDQVEAQWLRTNSVVAGAGSIDPVKSQAGNAGYAFTRFVHSSKANGASVIEYYVVDGMGHAWPGGKDGGSYSDPKGPDASALLWAFFKTRTLGKPLDAPAVVLPDSPAGTPDGGGASSGSMNPGGGTSGSTATTPSDGGGSGGCALARGGIGRTSFALGAVGGLSGLLAIALIAMRRRRR